MKESSYRRGSDTPQHNVDIELCSILVSMYDHLKGLKYNQWGRCYQVLDLRFSLFKHDLEAVRGTWQIINIMLGFWHGVKQTILDDYC